MLRNVISHWTTTATWKDHCDFVEKPVTSATVEVCSGREGSSKTLKEEGWDVPVQNPGSVINGGTYRKLTVSRICAIREVTVGLNRNLEIDGMRESLKDIKLQRAF